MSEREKERLIWIAGIGAAVIILLWLWWRMVGAPATAAAQAAPTTTLGNPPPQITLNFQNPSGAFTNQATGYVPLFGFIGYSGAGFG